VARKRTVRAQLLTLLARERKTWNRQARKHEMRRPTQVRVARELKISERTLRRWKNEGVEPSRSRPQSQRAVRRLAETSGRELERLTTILLRDRMRHPKALKVKREKLPTLPPMHRRELKRYRFDRERGRTVATGETYESNWANYDVSGWQFKEIAEFLFQVWRGKRPFQFVYEVPAGGSLPASGGKPARRVRKKTRSATAPINPGAFETEDELLTFLAQYIGFERTVKGRRLLFIAVDDNRAGTH